MGEVMRVGGASVKIQKAKQANVWLNFTAKDYNSAK